MTNHHRFIVLPATLCLLLAAGCGSQQKQPGDQPASVSSEAYSIPCETYTLPNGLRVTLMEDHTLPRASVNTWYRVGARNEPPGRSGFAHLFEHLMFMGTKRVPGGDFDNLMEAGGGSNNASTSLDRTNYFSSGPSSLLPTLLWLDADRLEDMGLMMTQEKLDKQRDVVRNERRQTTENAPYGRAYEASYQLLYPAGHPYHNGVIGTHADLEAAQVDDVKNFFSTFYTAGNTALVVAGDFDSNAIKPLVAKLFGTLPPGNTAPQVKVPMPKLDRVLRATYLDKVQLPAVEFAFHSPGQLSEGDAEMDLIGLILSDGNGSRLYKRLVVQEGLAAEVSASQDSSALSSVFRVTVMTKPDADLARVEAIMEEELTRLINEGPTAAELEQRKTQIEVGKLTRLQSIEARADALNEYLYYFGFNAGNPAFNPADGLKRDLDRYRNATAESVKAWAKKVLTLDARLVGVVLPEEPERAASGRDERPADLPSAPFTPPTPVTISLSNGMEAMVFSRPGLPLVSMGILFTPPAGSGWDPAEKAGRAATMARMLSEGTGGLDGAAFAAKMQSLGASFGAGADVEGFNVNLSVLKKNLDEAMGLAAGAVLAPRMNADDFARVKRLRIDGLRQENDEPRAVAPKVSARALFGGETAYGSPVGGSIASVESLTLADAVASHNEIVKSAKATIVLSGEITPDEARSLLEKHFGGRLPPGAEAPKGRAPVVAPKTDTGGMRVLIVDRPGAVQTMVHLRAPGAGANDPRRAELNMLNTLLGGSFTSRLNNNLREVHGYTYGARTGFSMGPTVGSFTASSAVRADATGAALKEFMGELTRIGSGDISAEEAAKAGAVTMDNMVEPFGTIGGVTGVALNTVEDRLPWSSLAAEFARMKTVDQRALNAIAKTAVDLDHAVLVLVGDSTLIRAQLEATPEVKHLLDKAVEVTAEGEKK